MVIVRVKAILPLILQKNGSDSQREQPIPNSGDIYSKLLKSQNYYDQLWQWAKSLYNLRTDVDVLICLDPGYE